MSPIEADHAGYTHDGAEGQASLSPIDRVMENAERQTEKSNSALVESEERRPDRQISTARSPSAERGEASGFTLPVVEEVGESSSTGRGSRRSERSQSHHTLTPSPRRSRETSPVASVRSHRRYRHNQMDGANEERDMEQHGRGKQLPHTPPKTPPKDSKDTSLAERPRSRMAVNKELPPPPPEVGIV